MKKNRKKIILGCDKDGVICNFTKQYIKVYNDILTYKRTYFKILDENWEPEIYSFENNLLIDKDVHDVIRRNKFGEIMRDAEMYKNADLFVFDLEALFPNFVFITHQYTPEAKLATFNWLIEHKFPISCIFSDGLEKWRYCDILIDDKIENLEKMEKHGKVGICLARNWNKTYNGLRFKSYDEIIKYLNITYG